MMAFKHYAQRIIVLLGFLEHLLSTVRAEPEKTSYIDNDLHMDGLNPQGSTRPDVFIVGGALLVLVVGALYFVANTFFTRKVKESGINSGDTFPRFSSSNNLNQRHLCQQHHLSGYNLNHVKSPSLKSPTPPTSTSPASPSPLVSPLTEIYQTEYEQSKMSILETQKLKSRAYIGDNKTTVAIEAEKGECTIKKLSTRILDDNHTTVMQSANGNQLSSVLDHNGSNSNEGLVSQSLDLSCISEQSNGSLSSLQIANGGIGLGILHFKLRFKNGGRGGLIVSIVGCDSLPVQDTLCDPYVKLQLLPGKQQRVKTRVLRHTKSPSFNEDFTFYGISEDMIQDLTLHFLILSFDRFSRDVVIGEVSMALTNIQVSEIDNHELEFSRDIQPRNLKVRNQGRGEILLSLCWQPLANRVTVVILKARNLPKMDVSGLADPYVKVYLLYDGQRVAKKKTRIKKRTLNPVFNESFVFDLPKDVGDNLEKISLQFLLLDWDRVTKNEVIGRLELGSGSVIPTSQHHWSEVLTCPRRQIAEWHKLQD